MIQKNYLCVYGVYCICVVHARVCRYASLYMHKQRQRASMTGISLSHFLPPCHEAASLSELEAHSFALAGWPMRLQDLSISTYPWPQCWGFSACATMPGFLHMSCGFEFRSSCLQSKHPYLLSCLPSPVVLTVETGSHTEPGDFLFS